jgi:ATP-dependent exoDNAse (exonuclease V) beta subunit
VLYDYARNYEAGAFKGLYNFIHFVNELIDKDTTFDDNREGGEEDAVKIVTCHASKGLEYPVVFLVEAGKTFTNRDARGRLVIDEDFGISFRLRSPSGLAVVNSPVQDLVNHYVYRKSFEEELRVLYVALTRAREQLYVTGVCSTVKRDEYDKKLSVLRDTLSPYSVRELASTLEIMMVAGESSRALGVDDFLPKVVGRVENFEDFAEISDENESTATENTPIPCEFSDIFL